MDINGHNHPGNSRSYQWYDAVVANRSTSTSSALVENEYEIAPIGVNVEPDIICKDILSESDDDFAEGIDSDDENDSQL